jgi:hypothetical protein
MTVGIVMTVCNIKTAHRGIIITMPTVITLSPTLCDISILHASASRCGGPNGVASSASASWSVAKPLPNEAQGDVHGALTELCTELWGSILMFQTILAVSPIRKAVVADRHNYADRHNPITYVIDRTIKSIIYYRIIYNNSSKLLYNPILL